MAAVPLRRNRDFMLLQAGQLVSTLGSQSTSVVYPLLVLAVTGSPLLAGAVGFVRILPGVLFSLFGGVAADRYDRRMLLVGSDTVRALSVGSLVVALVLQHLTMWHVVMVAFVEGSVATVFRPAILAALRYVVPAEQLSAAVSTQQARAATASLAGPPLGGALFGLSHAVPFVADAASYLVSVASLLLIRKPLQETRSAPVTRLRAQLAEGWRFLWHQPFLRTTTFLYGLTNFVGPGVLLAIVVVGSRQGLSGATIGAFLSAFSACLLIGSLVSGFLRRVLSPRTIFLLELCAWPATALFLLWPSAYLLAASILPAGLAIPVTDSVVVSHRLATTPDRLVGRVESVRSNIALGLAPLGSLGAGFLLSTFSDRIAMLVFVTVAFALPIWGALSPALQTASTRAETPVNGVGSAPDDIRRHARPSRTTEADLQRDCNGNVHDP
jgi:MFS family permease